jgi:hypothetical protein
MITHYENLRVGSMVKNIKTSKNWMITDFNESYSNVNRKSPDKLMVRITNGIKFQTITIEDLKKKFSWQDISSN